MAGVVVAPWLFGAAEPWAYLAVCLVVNVGVSLWLLGFVLHPGRRLRCRTAVWALLLLLGYLLLQATPLPRRIVDAANPRSARSWRAERRLLTDISAEQHLAAFRLSPVRSTWLSEAPGPTWRSAGLLAAYVGVFLVAAHAFSSYSELRRWSGAIVASAFLMATIGIVQSFSGTNRIFWFHQPRFGGHIFGAFTNRNHFASFMNLAAGAGVGLLLAWESARARPTGRGWRRRAQYLLDRASDRTVLLGFALIVMVLSIFVSLSRGAMVSLLLAGGAVAVVSWRKWIGGRGGRAVVAVAVVVASGILWLGWRPVAARLGTMAEIDLNTNVRTITTMDTLRMFGDAPVTGCGFGAFQFVFPRYQRAVVDKRWLHAHNDYAQLLAEGGLVGTSLWAIALMGFVGHIRGRIRPGDAEDEGSPGDDAEGRSVSRHRSRILIAGLAVGLGAIALHSLVDYSLHKPGVAFTFAALAGMAVSAAGVARTERADRRPRPDAGGRRRWAAPVVRLVAVIGIGTLAALSLVELTALRGELAFARFLWLERTAQEAPTGRELSSVVRDTSTESELVMLFARDNPDALWEVARMYTVWAKSGVVDPLLTLRLGEKAVGFSLLAVQAAPSDFANWSRLARALDLMFLPQQAALCLERARELAPEGVEPQLLRTAPPAVQPRPTNGDGPIANDRET